MKEEDTVDRKFKGSEAKRPEAGPKIGLLRSAVKKYCFIRDILPKDFENEYNIETGSALIRKMSLVLAEPPYDTCSAQGQSKPGQNVVSKRDMEDGVRQTGNFKAFLSMGIFCLDLMSYKWSRIVRASEKEIEDVEEILREGKDK